MEPKNNYIILALIWLGIVSAFIPWTHGEELITFNPKPPEVKEAWNLHVLKGDYNAYQYRYTDYAWQTWHDREFLYLLASENGLFNADRIGVTGDIGFCQISPDWHPRITNDPRFHDPEWQLAQCYRLFTGGTKFYGYDRLHDPKFRSIIESKFNL